MKSREVHLVARPTGEPTPSDFRIVTTDVPDPDGDLATRAVTGAGAVSAPLDVADRVLEAIETERFLMLPHEEIREFLHRKVSDHDRWIAGMQRFRKSLS